MPYLNIEPVAQLIVDDTGFVAAPDAAGPGSRARSPSPTITSAPPDSRRQHTFTLHHCGKASSSFIAEHQLPVPMD